MAECYANGFISSNVGMINKAVNIAALFGVFNVSEDNFSSANPVSHYVDTAYGALASTAVAPTATTSKGPWVGLIA